MSMDEDQSDQNLDGDELDPEVLRLDLFLKKLFQSNELSAARDSGALIGKPSPDSTDFLDTEESELTFLNPGTMIGRFKILKLIGFGGFGVVYHAVDDASGQEVALKLPRQDRMNSGQVLKRFYREARLASSLKHRSIVGVIETSIEGEHFYIATEFENGMNLKNWLECHAKPVPIELVVEWGIELADALQYAFLNGIVHRDLKPTNILIVEEGGELGRDNRAIGMGLIPRITDFGLAYSVNDPLSGTSASGMMIGTPGYMAPEQVLNGMNRVDIRADIYAIGLIMAEMLSGLRIRKFDHMMDFVVHLTRDDPSRDLDLLNHLIPEDLRAILLKAIEVEPEDRYQSPGEFQDDLVRFQKGRPTLVRPLSLYDRSLRYAWRYPYQAAIALITSVFIAVFLVNQWFHNMELKNNENMMIRMAYNSKIRLGFSELRDERMEAVHEILDETRGMERADGSGLKDLSWKYLNRFATSKFTTHRMDRFSEYIPGKKGTIIQATYDKNKDFITKYSMLQGNIHFEDQAVRFDNGGFNLTLGESILAIYQERSAAKELILFDGLKSQILDSPFKSFLYSPIAKKIFFLNANQDLKSDPIQHQVAFLPFDTESHKPRMSLDGRKITGLLKSTETNPPAYFWANYNTLTGEMEKTGIQVSVEGNAWRAELSQHGNLAVYYAGDTGTIHVYDTVNRKEVHGFKWLNPTVKNHPESLAIDEVKGRILVADQQNGLFIIKIGESEPYGEFHNKLRPFHQVGFFPDGRVYWKWGYSDRFWIWNPDQPISSDLELDHTDEVWSLTFDSSGETLASAGDDNRVHVWNLKTKTSKLLDMHQSLVSCGKFSPDHTQYAACDFSGYLKVWDTKTWELLKTIQITQQKLRSLAWSRDGRSIVCVGGREVLDYEMSTGHIQKYECDGAVYDIVFSKSGDEMMVSVQKDDKGSLLFLSFQGAKLTKELFLDHDPTRLALSPDGKTIVTGYYNGGIGVISAVTRTIVKQVGTETTFGAVWSLGFTTDGKNLIASGGDNRLILYETETWEPLGTIMDHKSRVHAIAVSENGSQFATGDMTGKIIIHEIPK